MLCNEVNQLKLEAIQEVGEEAALENFVHLIGLAVIAAHKHIFLIGQVLEIQVECI